MTTTSELDVSIASPVRLGVWRLLAGVVDTLVVWHARSRDRRHLVSLDDHMLRDIGVTRVAVRQEALKPFWRG